MDIFERDFDDPSKAWYYLEAWGTEDDQWPDGDDPIPSGYASYYFKGDREFTSDFDSWKGGEGAGRKCKIEFDVKEIDKLV